MKLKLTRFCWFNSSLHDLQLISTGVAHIEPLGARNGPRINDYFDTGLAKFLFGLKEVGDGKTYVSRTQRAIHVFNGKVQLIVANLIPGTDLAGGCGLGHLSETQYRSIEMFSRRLQLRRHGNVYVMKIFDHGDWVRSPTVREGYLISKCTG